MAQPLPSSNYQDVGTFGWGSQKRKLKIGYECYPGAAKNIKANIRYFYETRCPEGKPTDVWNPTQDGVSLTLREFCVLLSNLKNIQRLINLFENTGVKCDGKPGYSLSVIGQGERREVYVMHDAELPSSMKPVTLVVLEADVPSKYHDVPKPRSIVLPSDRWQKCLPFLQELYLTLQNVYQQRKQIKTGTKPHRNMGESLEQGLTDHYIGQEDEASSSAPTTPELHTKKIAQAELDESVVGVVPVPPIVENCSVKRKLDMLGDSDSDCEIQETPKPTPARGRGGRGSRGGRKVQDTLKLKAAKMTTGGMNQLKPNTSPTHRFELDMTGVAGTSTMD